MRAFLLMQTNSRFLVIDITKRTYAVFDKRVMVAFFEDENKTGPLLPKDELEQIRNMIIQDRA